MVSYFRLRLGVERAGEGRSLKGKRGIKRNGSVSSSKKIGF